MNLEFARRACDIEILNHLRHTKEVQSYEKTMLASLMMRYAHDQGMLAVVLDVVKAWDLEPKALFNQTRQIWQNGYRPSDLEIAGSAWDANTTEETK